MVATKNNRRAKYSRQMIETTVLKLLETKPVTAISVTEVCQLADVNRTTFYRHYTDIPQCLESIELDFLKSTPFDQQATPMANVEGILTAFYQQPQLSNLVFVEGKTKLLERMRMTAPEDVPTVDPYQMVYIFGGVKDIIRYWVKQGMPQTPKELTHIIFKNVQAEDLPPIDHFAHDNQTDL